MIPDRRTVPEDKRCTYCQRGKVWIQEGRATQDCPRCFGTGQRGAKRPADCEACRGTGYSSGQCVECMGTGKA